MRKILKLYFVVNPNDCYPNNLEYTVTQAIMGGVTCVQLRDKQASESRLIQHAKKLLKILPARIPLIINDHVEIARFLKIGLHLGNSDCHCDEARKILGPKQIIGLSITNDVQARQVIHQKNDYFGIGPIFPTATKIDAAPPLGVTQLSNIFNLVSFKPCVAIGGINHTTIQTIKNMGIDGIAIAAAIAKASNPCLATQQLLAAMTTS